MSIHDEPDHRWETSALCAQVDPDVFFMEKGGNPKPAKAVCVECPVRPQCLTRAMRAEAMTMREGIYGGLSPQERETLGRNGWRPGDLIPPVRGLPSHGHCPQCGKKCKSVELHVFHVHAKNEAAA